MTLEEFINLEEQIDEERTRIAEHGRPVTEQNYLVWRLDRDDRRKKQKVEKDSAKLTGIQLFINSTKNNEIIQDHEGAEDVVRDTKEEQVDIEHEIVDKDNFFFKPGEIKDDGTKWFKFFRKYIG